MQKSNESLVLQRIETISLKKRNVEFPFEINPTLSDDVIVGDGIQTASRQEKEKECQ